MQPRKRRPTFDIFVQNIPKFATQRDVEKKFTAYGEIQSLYVKQVGQGDTKEAVIRYLCEPDANKATKEHHGTSWGKNIITVKKFSDRVEGSNRSNNSRPPFYPPHGPNNVQNMGPANMNHHPYFSGLYPECFNFPTQMNSSYESYHTRGGTASFDRKKHNARGMGSPNRNASHDAHSSNLADLHSAMNPPYQKLNTREGTASFDHKKHNAKGMGSLNRNASHDADSPNVADLHSVEIKEPLTLNRIPINLNFGGILRRKNSGSKMSLPTLDVQEIHCTYVEDCITFYGVCSSRRTSLDALSSRLQILCPALPAIKCVPLVGNMYGTRYSGDQQWYRCKILFNNRIPGKSRVQYVDYGNCEDVDLLGMVDLPKSLTGVPCYAPKCVLVTVNATTEVKAAREGSLYLQEYILGKFVNIQTYSPADSLVYEVIECSLDQSDVIRDLAKNRYVTYKNTPQIASRPILAQHSIESTPIPSPKPINPTINYESGDAKSKLNFSKPKSVPVDPQHKKLTSFALPKSDKKISLENKGIFSPAEKEKMKNQIHSFKAEAVGWQQKYKVLEKALKEKEAEALKYSVVKQLETVASHVQLVNSIRSNPLPKDNDICAALAILIRVNDSSNQEKCNLEKTNGKMLGSYRQLLSDIVQCTDKAAQEELVEKKNSCKEELCENLKRYEEVYLASQNQHLEIDSNTIQEITQKLKSKEKSTVDLAFDNTPFTIEDILFEYNSMLETKNAKMEDLRKVTDAAHADFHLIFSDLLKSFDLYSDTKSMQNSEKKLPFLMPEGLLTSDKLKKCLDSLWIALEAEVKALYSECDFKKSKKCTLVQCLIRELQNLRKREKKEEHLVKEYRAILEELLCDGMLPKKLDELAIIRQGIKQLKSRLRHKLVDKKDLDEGDHSDSSEIEKVNSAISNFQEALHLLYIREDGILKALAGSFATNYPEFDLQHPELNLTFYKEFDGLYKQHWDIDEFSLEKCTERGNMCYKAMYDDQPVIIKEFWLDYAEKSEKLFERVMKWHSLSTDYVVPINAVLKKGDRQMFIVTPWRPTLLSRLKMLSKSEICDTLSAVLNSLNILHKASIVHGSLNLSTVLIDKEEVSLDFCFGNNPLVPASDAKEISFQPPESLLGAEPEASSDMYSFGCLVLSVLFPHVQLSCSLGVAPDISSYQKQQIEENLSPSGFKTIADLLHQKSHRRPTSRKLLEGTFLRDIFTASERVNEPEIKVNEPIDEDSDIVNETLEANEKVNDVNGDSSAMHNIEIPRPKPFVAESKSLTTDEDSSNDKDDEGSSLARLLTFRESLVLTTGSTDTSSVSDKCSENE